MTPFEAVLEAARAAAGGAAALAASLPRPKSAEALRAVPDDRYLSLMCRRIFRAGLRHRMVDERWPAFEELFFGFHPERVRFLSDEELESLLGETRIIRHWAKIKSVRANAHSLAEVAAEHGGFGAYLADWPGDAVVDLWEDLRRRFVQLGGRSAPYFLRMAEKDTFVLTRDVVHGLNRWGAFAGRPTTGKDRRAVQAAFNRWAAESGRPLCQVSRILAWSVG